MPTLNERRAADHFIKPAGIAGVYADARGAIGAIDVVGIECDRGLALFCCTAGRQRLIAEKAAARLQAGAGQAAAAVAIRAAAAELRFGLSPRLCPTLLQLRRSSRNQSSSFNLQRRHQA
jgi:hypothetical protein